MASPDVRSRGYPMPHGVSGMTHTPSRDDKRPTKGSLQWFKQKQKQWNETPRKKIVALPSSFTSPETVAPAPEISIPIDIMDSPVKTSFDSPIVLSSSALIPSSATSSFSLPISVPISAATTGTPATFAFPVASPPPSSSLAPTASAFQTPPLAVPSSEPPRELTHRERLIEFFQKNNPSKLGNVDALLEKFKGKEDLMFQKVEERYGNSQQSSSTPKNPQPDAAAGTTSFSFPGSSPPTTSNHRERLIAFFQKNNPSKLGNVDALLEKFKGKEDLMFQKVEERAQQSSSTPIAASDSSKKSYRERLIELFQKHNPSKLNTVDALLEKFKGKEEALLQKAKEKYASGAAQTATEPPVQQAAANPPAPQSTVPTIPMTAETDDHRKRLIDFYQQYNPSKLDTVEETLVKFQGKETELFEKLKKKYIKDGMLPPTGTGPTCFLEFALDGTAVGRVEVKLFQDKTPLAAENFRCLCTGEKGMGRATKELCFRGSKIHRIAPGFCIQGGDFTKGDGTGGESIYPPNSEHGDMWGKFKDETPFLMHNRKGLLSMANNGPNKNGSQFFFTLRATPQLDGKHVVFGEVVTGLELVEELGKLATDPKQRPLKSLVIVDCGQLLAEDGSVVEAPTAKSSSSGGDSGSNSKSPFGSFGGGGGGAFGSSGAQQSPFGSFGSTEKQPSSFSSSALTSFSAVASPFAFGAKPIEGSATSAVSSSSLTSDTVDAAKTATPSFSFGQGTTSFSFGIPTGTGASETKNDASDGKGPNAFSLGQGTTSFSLGSESGGNPDSTADDAKVSSAFSFGQGTPSFSFGGGSATSGKGLSTSTATSSDFSLGSGKASFSFGVPAGGQDPPTSASSSGEDKASAAASFGQGTASFSFGAASSDTTSDERPAKKSAVGGDASSSGTTFSFGKGSASLSFGGTSTSETKDPSMSSAKKSKPSGDTRAFNPFSTGMDAASLPFGASANTMGKELGKPTDNKESASLPAGKGKPSFSFGGPGSPLGTKSTTPATAPSFSFGQAKPPLSFDVKPTTQVATPSDKASIAGPFSFGEAAEATDSTKSQPVVDIKSSAPSFAFAPNNSMGGARTGTAKTQSTGSESATPSLSFGLSDNKPLVSSSAATSFSFGQSKPTETASSQGTGTPGTSAAFSFGSNKQSETTKAEERTPLGTTSAATTFSSGQNKGPNPFAAFSSTAKTDWKSAFSAGQGSPGLHGALALNPAIAAGGSAFSTNQAGTSESIQKDADSKTSSGPKSQLGSTRTQSSTPVSSLALGSSAGLAKGVDQRVSSPAKSRGSKSSHASPSVSAVAAAGPSFGSPPKQANFGSKLSTKLAPEAVQPVASNEAPWKILGSGQSKSNKKTIDPAEKNVRSPQKPTLPSFYFGEEKSKPIRNEGNPDFQIKNLPTPRGNQSIDDLRHFNDVSDALSDILAERVFSDDVLSKVSVEQVERAMALPVEKKIGVLAYIDEIESQGASFTWADIEFAMEHTGGDSTPAQAPIEDSDDLESSFVQVTGKPVQDVREPSVVDDSKESSNLEVSTRDGDAVLVAPVSDTAQHDEGVLQSPLGNAGKESSGVAKEEPFRQSATIGKEEAQDVKSPIVRVGNQQIGDAVEDVGNTEERNAGSPIVFVEHSMAEESDAVNVSEISGTAAIATSDEWDNVALPMVEDIEELDNAEDEMPANQVGKLQLPVVDNRGVNLPKTTTDQDQDDFVLVSDAPRIPNVEHDTPLRSPEVASVGGGEPRVLSRKEEESYESPSRYTRRPKPTPKAEDRQEELLLWNLEPLN
ncbi:cis-trans isomerase [Seminavis robusta]|uniref:peptidylprolyl isomerase n=1 Tax=Seminavis robusta TaxID=568900 RepID=A0A9N8EUV2_9STRA|nr:cis-trans isomerase [Seminavis robusta]|eukprot:Sro1686_g291150.1 cis-trans isomerase (1777) ;mRNA; f:10005-15335